MVEKDSKDKKTNYITCPNCYTKHPIKRNPLYCIECNSRFKRGERGNLIVDEEGMGAIESKGVQRKKRTAEEEKTTVQKPEQKSQPMSFQRRMQQQRQTIPSRLDPRGVQNYSVSDQAIYQREARQQQQDYRLPMTRKSNWSIAAGFGIPILSYIIIIILTALIVFAIGGLNIENLQSLTEDMTFLFITGSLSLVFFFVPVFYIQKYYPQNLSFKERLAKLGLPLKKYKSKKLFREILLGIAIGVGGTFIVLGLQIISFYLVDWLFSIDLQSALEGGALSEFGISVPNNLTDLILFILMVTLFVGVPEEVLFRGFVQKSFESKWSRSAATWLTAVYFAMFHIIVYILEPALFIYLFIPYLGVSLLLGLVRNWRNDLYAAIIAHIIYDITQITILYSILN